jgi:tripartite-type tricarboxylate transporter receptor subunit TctC
MFPITCIRYGLKAFVLAACLGSGLGAAAAEPVWAPDGKLQRLPDGFPSMPIRVWNTQPPGHADEAEARMLAKAAQQFSPVPVVVDSAAAGPLIVFAWLDRLQTLPAGLEGQHVAVGSVNGLATRLVTYDLAYDVDALKKATLITAGYTANVLVASPNAPFKTAQEFVAYAKANPGKVRVATCQPGCGAHITLQQFTDSAGIKVRMIPHDGTAQSLLTLQGGGVDATVAQPGYVLPLIKDGTVIPLVQWRPSRSDKMPDVPTGTDLGLGAGVLRSVGLFTHQDVTPERKAWLIALFKKAYETAEFQKFNGDRDTEYFGLTGDKSDAFIQETYDAIRPVTVDLGLATEKQAKAYKDSKSK